MSELNIINFGKYKGRAIEVIYAIDTPYALWMYRQGESLLEPDCGIYKFLKEKFHDDDGTPLTGFGKYSNKTIKWVYDNDKKYFEWLTKCDFIQKKPKLKEAIELIK